ncbi:hypothetical protein [Acidiphilium sp.]|uniref:hypothetical protein n=1 Tax=Acidiphilium sp. TaxID=527 RepID=UPI003CFE7DD8
MAVVSRLPEVAFLIIKGTFISFKGILLRALWHFDRYEGYQIRAGPEFPQKVSLTTERDKLNA